MRDTEYATEIVSSVLTFESGAEARIGRLRIKSFGKVEIRFLWWKDGHMMMRRLDLSEADLTRLLAKGIRKECCFQRKIQTDALPERGDRM